MKKLITFIFAILISTCLFADLFLAIPADASKEELAEFNKMINMKIDPDYDIQTMGVKMEKDKVVYLCGNWDVDGRKFLWKEPEAKADIAKEAVKTPSLINVVVESKVDDKFKASTLEDVPKEEVITNDTEIEK